MSIEIEVRSHTTNLLPEFDSDCGDLVDIDWSPKLSNNINALNRHFAERPLEELLCWSLATFGDKVAQITSFGASGMVILDHLARLSPGVKVITIDTGFLFPESYQLWETIQGKYPIDLIVKTPDLSPQAQSEQYGPKLWQTNPDQCCFQRKVVPLQSVLAGLDAWFTGLRRDQSPTRANIPLLTWDDTYNLVKINPLAGWTRKDVWGHLVKYKVPYNKLHDQGYSSIGCTHCTQAATNPNDERSGRWQGLDKRECGIHLSMPLNVNFGQET